MSNAALVIGLLTVLGSFLAAPSCHSTKGSEQAVESGSVDHPVAEGIWGGEHIQIEVTNKEVTVEFDCAHGTITGPLLTDSEGRFQATGTFQREHGGPVRNGETGGAAAIYSGSVKDKRLTLTVKFANSSEVIGTFKLMHGSDGQLTKCR
jgi:hypothetical protein